MKMNETLWPTRMYCASNGIRTDTIPDSTSVFWYLPKRAIKSTARVVKFWEGFGLTTRKDAPMLVTGYV